MLGSEASVTASFFTLTLRRPDEEIRLKDRVKNKHSQKLPKVSHSKGWTWWHMPAIPEPGRMKPPVMSTSLAYRESPSEAGDRMWFSQGSTGSACTKRRLQTTYYTNWAHNRMFLQSQIPVGEARETEVQNQNHPSFHNKVSARLGCRRPCLGKQEGLER